MTLRPEMCLFMTERHHSSDPSSPQRRFLKEADAYMGLPEIIGHGIWGGGGGRCARGALHCPVCWGGGIWQGGVPRTP